MTHLLPNPYNPEHNIDYMKVKAHQKLLELAEIDSVDQEQEFETSEQPGKKMKGPTGLFDIFQVDQLDSSQPLQNTLKLLREENPLPGYFRDEISSCQDPKVFLPLQTPKLIDAEETNASAIELTSDKIAKIQDLDTAELERLEATEEERREAEQPKEKERKTTVIEGFTQWVSNLCSGIWGWFSGNKTPTVTVPESSRGSKASEQAPPVSSFNSKPQLKAPGAVDMVMIQRFLESEKAALQHQKELQEQQSEIEAVLPNQAAPNQPKTNVGMTPEEEVKLLNDYISTMKKAQGLRKTDELLSKDAIMAQQKRYEEIQEQLNKEFEKIAQRSWMGKIVQWVTAATVTASIITGVITIATGGLGALFNLIPAALALVSGALQATKAVFDYQTRAGQARIKENSNEINSIKEKMRSQVGKMQKAMEAINSQWQMMSQAAKAHYEANRFALTGRSGTVS